MRVPVSWLREFVEVGEAAGALAEVLGMGGLPVDAIEPVGTIDRAIRVGRLLDVAAHPDAERLRVCRVDVGEEAPRVVVSGAPGLATGQQVAVALPGARLADGREVGAVTLRGVASAGVLCSEAEVGLGDDASRVLELTGALRAGTPLRDLPGVDDVVLDVDVTPNRGDCLSMLGIAREVATLTGRALRRPRVRLAERGEPADVTVRVDAPDGCPLYAARVVGALSRRRAPLWLELRLRRAGMRPLGDAVVDATNYVMLERGQPLHAFDAARIDARTIVVRRARPGERLRTLDDVERTLVADDLVIADPRRALAIAGVMGGADSEMRPETGTVVLESAFFDPASVRRTARRLGLVSQAAYRFERRVDPEQVTAALDRAAALIAELTGGQCAPGRVAVGAGVPEPATIALRPRRATSVLGVAVERGEIRRRLRALGATLRTEGGTLLVRPPSHRGDLLVEEDLIEELARIGGYERIPVAMPQVALRAGEDTPRRACARRLRGALAAEGLREVVTPPFCDPALDAAVPGIAGAALEPLALENPLSAETGALRRSPLSGLLGVLRTNRDRGAEYVGVFEIGKGYGVDPERRRREPWSVAMLLHGTWPPSGAERRGAAIDFFDGKGVVENVLEAFGHALGPSDWRRADDVAFLHPGKSVRIGPPDRPLGALGAIHPRVAQVLDLPREIVLAELDFERVGQYGPARLGVRALPRFPCVTRDIAMVVDEEFTAGAVLDAIRGLDEPLIESVRLFDCYRGEPVPPGKKSLAYTIAYRAPDRTLTDEEVNRLQDRVRHHLAGRFALDLRS